MLGDLAEAVVAICDGDDPIALLHAGGGRPSQAMIEAVRVARAEQSRLRAAIRERDARTRRLAARQRRRR